MSGCGGDATKPVMDLRLNLAQSSSSEFVGNPHTVTATLTNGAIAQPGIAILFTVTGASAQGPTSRNTDATGIATLQYTGTAAGVDVITVSVPSQPGLMSTPAALNCTWKNGSVHFLFDHAVDGQVLGFDDLRYRNAAGNDYSVTNLFYYVSNIALHGAGGSVISDSTVHYRDGRVASTRDWLLDDVPSGSYASVSFTFGLDERWNRAGALPTTQESLNMQWSPLLGGGYHYMKLEGFFSTGGGARMGYFTHTGRIQDPGDPVAHPHFFTVTLPLGPLSVHQDSWDVQIVMNLNGWYATPNLLNFDIFGPSIMDNLGLQQQLQENGPHAFSIGTVSHAGP